MSIDEQDADAPTRTGFAADHCFAEQQADLDRLARRARFRSLKPAAGIDFSSNDYLGLARAPRMADAVRNAIERGVPVGSGGSRLLRGNDASHEALEAEAAAFFGAEAALYFSSGYAANATLLSALPQRRDLIVHDALIHASAHEGMRLSRADKAGVAHNDPQAFEDAIVKWRAGGGSGRVWMAVESLYSMDGDVAPLDDLIAVADRHDAILLIDEAHATGVFGPAGRGLAADLEGRGNVVTLRTCGKALGAEGALVLGPRIVRDFLINRGRGFIFSTAPSPLMAEAVRESLKILRDEPERRATLHARIALAGELLTPLGAQSHGTQILPLIIGQDEQAMAMADRLQQEGFDIRGIRPPTVPAGTARLRISLTLNAMPDDIRRLAATLRELKA
ncbi:MAG: 8-amino-7-oxononanoate synthase [Sphingobium sp.]|nr:8-amino-7-oxononanoate synthase [Sphingobium sp.]